ncbi:MAG: hypothetical protein A2X57_11925 [Nitrospirae bacterium GWD2_57_8]|jgi:hypothetical protein|nr:MAG: hypothetical protein A2X57_11925 [Nitrospirae bacterium GWD2_57_8]
MQYPLKFNTLYKSAFTLHTILLSDTEHIERKRPVLREKTKKSQMQAFLRSRQQSREQDSLVTLF